jgi:hypothetical protein
MNQGMKKQVMWAVIAGLAVVGAIYALYFHRSPSALNDMVTRRPLLQPATQMPPAMTHPDTSGTLPLEMGNTSSAAPQLNRPGAPRSGLTPAPMAQDQADLQRRQAALEATLQKMQTLVQRGDQDSVAFSNAIADVEKANGSPMMGGVNLETLRHNIEISGQLHQLSQQMQALQSASDGASQPDTQALAAVKEKSAQLQALVKQLNPNIMQAPVAGATAQGQ